MRVFGKLLARESDEGTTDGSSQFKWSGCGVPAHRPALLPRGLSFKKLGFNTTSRVVLLATRTKPLAWGINTQHQTKQPGYASHIQMADLPGEEWS